MAFVCPVHAEHISLSFGRWCDGFSQNELLCCWILFLPIFLSSRFCGLVICHTFPTSISCVLLVKEQSRCWDAKMERKYKATIDLAWCCLSCFFIYKMKKKNVYYTLKSQLWWGRELGRLFPSRFVYIYVNVLIVFLLLVSVICEQQAEKHSEHQFMILVAKL